MKKNLQKFFTFSLLFAIFWFFQSEKTFAETPSCTIKSGPIKEMTDYANNLNKKLWTISANAKKDENCSRVGKTAYLVFDAAYADIVAMNHTFTDFRYNFQSIGNGGKNPFVKRDEKFFDTLEKNISKTAENLGNSCSLDSTTRKELHDLIIETQTLRNAYRKAALGDITVIDSNIKTTETQNLVNAINQSYNPNATASCIDDSQKQKSFMESLKSMINIGGKMDDSLSTWRKALALIRGGGEWMSASEVAAQQKSLLASELSRQWLSNNAKNTMLANFDCYKSRTQGVNHSENILEVRASCLQIPITGIDKVFALGDNIKSIGSNAKKTWNDFIWEAPTTDIFAERLEKGQDFYKRSINIEQMHDQLNLLTANETDNNKATQDTLIKLHMNLMETNNLLEERLPAMQNNCMKWNPWIVGWCR